MMHQIGIGEALWLALVALVRFGIPIAFAVWVFITLKRIRSNQETVLNRLDAIEKG